MENINTLKLYNNRINAHILLKNGNVYHCTGYIYDLCYRFVMIRYFDENDVYYALIDRATGLLAFKSKLILNLDKWFKINKERIFTMFSKSKKYKSFMKRWSKIAEKRGFSVWEIRTK